MLRMSGIAALLHAALCCATAQAARISEFTVDSRNVQVVFDEPMLTWQDPADVSAISLEPVPDCRWHWADEVTLNCEVDYEKPELRAATRYRLDLRAGLWSQTGVALDAQTSYADSRLPEASATIVEWKDGEPQIVVDPTLPVDADALQRVLRVNDVAGNAIDFRLVAIEEKFPYQVAGQDVVKYRLELDTAERRSGIVSVSVRPGLVSGLGPLPGSQGEELLQFYRNEPFRLRDWFCSVNWTSPRSLPTTQANRLECPAGTVLALEFSRKPDAASLARFKRSLPRGLDLGAGSERLPDALGRVDKTLLRKGWFVLLETTQASRNFDIELDTSFRAEDGSTLAEDVQLVLSSTDFPELVDFKKTRLVLKPDQAIPALGQVRNHPALTFDQGALAGASVTATTNKLPARNDNRLHDFSLPGEAPRDMRRNGGLISGTMTGMSRSGAYKFEYAYSPFHIATIRSPQQLLVWVSEWSAYESRANVVVELLRVGKDHALYVLASARTDSDGVAMLDPPSIAGEPDQLLVRASDGQRRSVVSIDHQVQGLSGHKWSSFEEGEPMNWGVTDRPLYRPGDTVHYRLWLRERKLNALQAAREASASMQLSLRSEGLDAEFLQWSSAMDASGSVAGELRLPTTLPDETYCIQIGDENANGWNTGACFMVANYHASPLWSSVTSHQPLAYDGDTVSFDIEAGFYSGGGAAGAKAEQQTLLMPLRLEQVFPEFGDYQFVVAEGETAEGGESFGGELPRFIDLDAEGKGEIRFVLHNSRMDNPAYGGTPIPFGKFEMTSHVGTSPTSYASSPAAEMRVSRFRRFVGLKIDGDLRADTDPQLTAIIIDAQGHRITADAPIDVSISAVPAPRAPTYGVPVAEPEPAPELARCRLAVNQPTRCAFSAPVSGAYRFVATSGDAAATSVQRYIASDIAPAELRSEIASIERVVTSDGSHRFKLNQPYARARVFFAVQHGRVLKHWIATIESTTHTFALDLPAAWAPGVTLSALILDLRPDRLSLLIQDHYKAASLDLDIDNPPPLSPLLIEVPAAGLAPGQQAEIRLRNAGTQPLDVTLAVVDEAVDALAPEISTLRDPQSEQWLGAMKRWSTPRWTALVEWDQLIPAGVLDAQSRIEIAVGPESHRADGLETIVVTGSRIRNVDLMSRGPVVKGQPQRGPRGNDRSATARARFLDTAYWEPSLKIAPGTVHSVRIALPDNLTRWKIFAWSSAGTGDFHLDEANLKSSLPIEVRTEMPVRLFPGDISDIALAARNHTAKSRALGATLKASGAGTGLAQSASATTPSERELRVIAQLRPQREGEVEVLASASAGTDRDAVIGKLAVASSVGRERMTLAGWIGADATKLHLPNLPEGADQAKLRIEVRRELDGLIEAWIVTLRDYRHRCWEQQLSRAVGAAAAMRLGRAASLWPDAENVVRNTLAGAPGFQEEGLFRFFEDGGSWGSRKSGNLLLSAYTLQALQTLRDWGYPTLESTTDKTREALQVDLAKQLTSHGDPSAERRDWVTNSAVLAALAGDVGNHALINEGLKRWESLDWYARSRLLLAAQPHRSLFDLYSSRLEALTQAAPLRAARRRLNSNQDRSAVMGSNLRDQCTLIDTLNRTNASAATIDEWRRGLLDLYAGTGSSADTQASAQCLMALLSLPQATSLPLPANVEIDLAGTTQRLQLKAEVDRAEWSAPLQPGLREIGIRSVSDEANLAVMADVSYRIDQRRSTASNVGLSITRDYSVMRDGAWKRPPADVYHAGDWIRIHLRISAGAPRYHVAVMDSVPGGFRPEDLTLQRVAGIELRGADAGSSWFGTKQLVDTEARFYAERLPPGSHDIYYYARAAHRGDFLALPARAELMYGSVSMARTAAARVQVTGADTEGAP